MTDREALHAALAIIDRTTGELWSNADEDAANETAFQAARERLAQLQGDVLVIEKVDGEWPDWAALMVTAVTPWFNSYLLNENVGPIVLDALLAHQKGERPL